MINLVPYINLKKMTRVTRKGLCKQVKLSVLVIKGHAPFLNHIRLIQGNITVYYMQVLALPRIHRENTCVLLFTS